MQKILIFWDYFCLWAGGRLALSGGNVYQQMDVVNELLRNGFTPKFWPGGFHNPPWSLWLFMLFGAMPFWISAFIWTSGTLGVFFYCCSDFTKNSVRLGLRKITLSRNELILSIICFFPLVKHLLWGQSTFLVLLALYCFFCLYSKQKFFYSGFVLSLSCIKAHLFIVFYFFLLASSYRYKQNGKVFTGLVIGFLIQAFLSYLLFPESYALFYEFIFNFAGDRKANPQVTAAHVIQLYTGFDKIHEIIFYLSIIIGTYLGLKKDFSIAYLIKTIIPLSLIMTPYAWSHDHLILLPSYLLAIQILKEKYPRDIVPIIVIPFLITLGFIGQHILNYEHITLWFPIALLWVNNLRTNKNSPSSF